MTTGNYREILRLLGTLGLLLSLVIAGCGGDDDGSGRAASASPEEVASAPEGERPVAEAGLSREVALARTVTLDGSASSDPGENDLAFAWTVLEQPAASTATFDNPFSEFPSFVADAEGIFRIQLVVSNTEVSSAPDLIFIIVTREEEEISHPIARAGADRRVPVFSLVTLDGEGSFDPGGKPLLFEWTILRQPVGSSIFLSQERTPNPQFTPQVEGDYQVLLTVRDPQGNLDHDFVTITAVPPGTSIPPQAEAGADQIARVDEVVRLDGTASFDRAGEPVFFDWKFVSRPAGSTAILAEANTAIPFFIPDVVGTYRIQLTIRDQQGSSNTSSVTVTVLPVNAIVPPLTDQGWFMDQNQSPNQDRFMDP